MDFKYIPNLLSEIDIPKDGIISRAVHADEHTRAILFGFDAGQELSEHTASMPAIIHILQGEASLTFGGESYESAAGAWTYMSANLPHSVHAKTPVIMLLTMLKSAKPK